MDTFTIAFGLPAEKKSKKDAEETPPETKNVVMAQRMTSCYF